MSPRFLIVFAAFSSVAAATAPASLLKFVLPSEARGFSFSAIEGTVWRGKIRDAHLQSIALGDVSFRLNALSLLKGTALIDVVSTGPGARAEGRLAFSVNGIARATNFRSEINLNAAAQRYRILGAPVEGTARLEIEDLKFGRNGCISARGDVWTDVLRGPAQTLRGEAFDLAGPISCDDDALGVALNGAGAEGAASVSLAITPQLTYIVDIEVAPQRSEIDQALRFIGFENGPGGLRYGATGAFKGV